MTVLSILPTEVVEEICGFLDYYSLKLLRLSCRTMRDQSGQHFFNRHFRCLNIRLDTRGMTRLIEIARYPKIAHGVRTLTLQPGRQTDFLNKSDIIARYRMWNGYGPDESTERDGDNWTLIRETMRVEAEWLELREDLVDHNLRWLAPIIQGLRNLRAIKIGRMGRLSNLRPEHENKIWDDSRSPVRSRLAGLILRIFFALSTVKTSVKTLYFGCNSRTWDSLGVHAFQIPIVEGLRATLEALERLSLCLSLWKKYALSGLEEFLLLVPNLRVLKIQFRVENFMEVVENREVISGPVLSVRFDHLNTFELKASQCCGKDLAAFVNRHTSLKRLKLQVLLLVDSHWIILLEAIRASVVHIAALSLQWIETADDGPVIFPRQQASSCRHDSDLRGLTMLDGRYRPRIHRLEYCDDSGCGIHIRPESLGQVQHILAAAHISPRDRASDDASVSDITN